MIYLLSCRFSVFRSQSCLFSGIETDRLAQAPPRPLTSDAAAGAEHDKVFPSRASWSSALRPAKVTAQKVMDGAGSVSALHFRMKNTQKKKRKKERKSPAVARHVPLHELRVLLIGRPAVEKHCLFSL